MNAFRQREQLAAQKDWRQSLTLYLTIVVSWLMLAGVFYLAIA